VGKKRKKRDDNAVKEGDVPVGVVIPTPIWLAQLAHALRQSTFEVKQSLVTDGGFSAKSIGLY
jgi:hypothetical protein